MQGRGVMAAVIRRDVQKSALAFAVGVQQGMENADEFTPADRVLDMQDAVRVGAEVGEMPVGLKAQGIAAAKDAVRVDGKGFPGLRKTGFVFPSQKSEAIGRDRRMQHGGVAVEHPVDDLILPGNEIAKLHHGFAFFLLGAGNRSLQAAGQIQNQQKTGEQENGKQQRKYGMPFLRRGRGRDCLGRRRPGIRRREKRIRSRSGLRLRRTGGVLRRMGRPQPAAQGTRLTFPVDFRLNRQLRHK